MRELYSWLVEHCARNKLKVVPPAKRGRRLAVQILISVAIVGPPRRSRRINRLPIACSGERSPRRLTTTSDEVEVSRIDDMCRRTKCIRILKKQAYISLRIQRDQQSAVDSVGPFVHAVK